MSSTKAKEVFDIVELLEMILKELDTHELIALQRVCKCFCSVIQSSSRLWPKLYRVHVGELTNNTDHSAKSINQCFNRMSASKHQPDGGHMTLDKDDISWNYHPELYWVIRGQKFLWQVDSLEFIEGDLPGKALFLSLFAFRRSPEAERHFNKRIYTGLYLDMFLTRGKVCIPWEIEATTLDFTSQLPSQRKDHFHSFRRDTGPDSFFDPLGKTVIESTSFINCTMPGKMWSETTNEVPINETFGEILLWLEKHIERHQARDWS